MMRVYIRRRIQPTALIVMLCSCMLKVSLGFFALSWIKPCDMIRRQATEHVNVIAVDDKFSTDDTIVGVVSMNLLAPFYQHLSLLRAGNQTTTMVEEMIRRDRLVRVPCAVEQAAKSRPSILLLQEVEGGGNHPDMLVESTLKNIGYHGYVWSSLYPERAAETNDCVGLAVAFDRDRFDCIRLETFRRGQIVLLHDQFSGRDVVLANLHLNAKPSAIEARLHAVSNCMRRIEAVLARSDTTIAPPVVILGGDLNCEYPSVTTRLITAGCVPYGNVRERNHKVKLTKAFAKNLRHSLRFDHVYSGVFNATPVTVSLTGRGPGIMDHMFVCTSTRSGRTTPSRAKIITSVSGSKRRSRRQRALYSSTLDNQHLSRCSDKPVSIKEVLATVSSDEQYQIILKGLPNMQAGFPSDHLPIGVAFETMSVVSQKDISTSIVAPTAKSHSSLSHAAARRRDAYKISSRIRARHNVVLNEIIEWLPPGATKDKSLEHLKAPGLRNKSRAPDIVCIIGGTLFVIEVTVVAATNIERAVRIKKRKYADLPMALKSSPTVMDRNLRISHTIVLAFDDRGKADNSTITALRELDLAMQHVPVRGKNMTLEQVMRSIEDAVQGVKVESF